MKKLLLIASVIAAASCYAQSNTEQQTTFEGKSVKQEKSAKKPQSNTEQQTAFEEKSVKQEESANKPQLIISGSGEVHGNFTSPDHTYYKSNPAGYKKTNKDSTMTRICAGEANIAFKAIGGLYNWGKYGVVIDIDTMKDDTGVDKMYVMFYINGLGIFEMGNVKGPDVKLVYDGQRLIGGTCGVDGTVVHDIDYASGVISPVYMIGYTSKAAKIAYYSPKIWGFQFAAAITPDTKQHGHNDKDWHAGSASNGNDNGMFLKGDGKQKPSGRNNIVFALSHSHEFENGLTTKLSGVYLFEDTKALDVKSADADGSDIKLRNARSYHLSATVGYKQLQIGAGFINNGKSRTPKNASEIRNIGNFLSTDKANAGRAWNIGAKYTLDDHWAFSTVFHKTQRRVDEGQKTKGNMLTFAVEYKVCDGLMLFTEFDHISTKSTKTACDRYNMIFSDPKDKNAIKKQKCQLLAIGAKVSF